MLYLAAGRREDALAALQEAGKQFDDPDQFVRLALDLAGEELLAGNRANGLSLIAKA